MKLAQALIVLAFVAPFATGQDVKLPPGEPPRLILVDGVDVEKQTLRYTQAVTVVVPVSVTEKKLVGGKEVDISFTKYVTEIRLVANALPLRELKIFFPDGTKISAEDAVKRVKPGSSVVVASHEDVAVRRLFATVLRQDALIVIAPMTPPPPALPEPIPAPKKAP